MQVKNIDIRDTRGLKLVRCEVVPQVMVITGPNGCGKSTLLDCLRRGAGRVPVLYMGPHRAPRKQPVEGKILFDNTFSMVDMLGMQALPRIQGLNFTSDLKLQERDAWGQDNVGSFLKYGLCQIEFERRNAITRRFDKGQRLDRGDAPDIWAPLRDLVKNLLPHLEFSSVDLDDKKNAKVLWKVNSSGQQVDFDELSSGEKAVIQLFYPLLELKIKDLLRQLSEEARTEERGSGRACVLMDEPELHLHPIVQEKILDYIRRLAASTGYQFILATHSPTLVEHASSEELYLLRPTYALLEKSENQLIRVADSDRRLEALRSLFGATANVTAMKPIVVVEGVAPSSTGKATPDSFVFTLLDARFGKVTFISGGGKQQCVQTAENMREFIRSLGATVEVVALLDRDVDAKNAPEGCMYLPASMIENLLLEPAAIWESLEFVRHKAEFQCEADVREALQEIASQQYETEVERRCKAVFGVARFRPQSPLSDVHEQVKAHIEELQERFSAEKAEENWREARRKVDAIVAENEELLYFDGKRILTEFFRHHLGQTGMSKEIFAFGCAKRVSERTSSKNFFDSVFDRLGLG